MTRQSSLLSLSETTLLHACIIAVNLNVTNLISLLLGLHSFLILNKLLFH